MFTKVKSALLASELKNNFQVTGGGFRIDANQRLVFIAFPHKSFGDVCPQLYYKSGGKDVLQNCSSVDELISDVLKILDL